MKECKGCELKECREAILAHPGWNIITLGDKSVHMIFSSWGTIREYTIDGKTLPTKDMCAKCPGNRIIM